MLVRSFLYTTLVLLIVKYATPAPQVGNVTSLPPGVKPIPSIPPPSAPPSAKPTAPPSPAQVTRPTTVPPQVVNKSVPVPSANTLPELRFHDDHNSLNRVRRSDPVMRISHSKVGGSKFNEDQESETAKMPETNDEPTESFRDVVEVF